MGALLSSQVLKRYSIDIPAFYVGVSQFEYRQGGDLIDEYFAEVQTVRPVIKQIFARSFDPLQRIVSLLKETTGRRVRVAREDGYGEYCPIIIRYASAGLHLHSDFAPYNAPGWAIGAVDAQITWNLYVQVTQSGGVTTLYNFPWTASDDETSRRGLPPDDLEDRSDIDSFTFTPVTGDVVFFNPRNPHKVAAGEFTTGANRISIGSFVGRLPSGELILWG